MTQAVLVLNVGSSSIKYQLLELGGESDRRLATGLVERIGGGAAGALTHK